MNVAALYQKLVASARMHPPSAAVPYAFEKRVMARLAIVPVVDWWTFWARALWRAAAPCVAIMVLLSAWTLYEHTGSQAQETTSVDLESTVLAAIDHSGEAW